MRERGRLQLCQILEALVEAMQLGCGLLKPGVAAQQPRHVRVHLERFDHALGLAPSEPRDLAAREEIGELHERPGFAGGDSYNACHVMLLFPGVANLSYVDDDLVLAHGFILLCSYKVA